MIWSTPQPIFDALDREFGFVIDLCADIDNHKVNRYFPRETSLSHTWNGVGWAFLNPPYGREIALWMKQAHESTRNIVAFIPGRTNAPWWHDYVMHADEIRFVRRKVSYANGEGCKGVPPWGSVVAIFGRQRQSPKVTSWDWKVGQ